MPCHGVELGVLAGKLCVPDAQTSNTVFFPTPLYVMDLSQASWQGICASGTHRCPTLSTFPRHILTTDSLALYCNVISNVDRKSTRLYSSHCPISYTAFSLKKLI